MRARTWFVAAVTVMAAVVAPVHEPISAQAPSSIVISEFRLRGLAGGNDEFIELHNPGPAPVNVGGWQIRMSPNAPSPVVTVATIPDGTIVNPGCFYLLASTGYSGTAVATGNQVYTTVIPDDGGFALTLPDATTIIDQVGHGPNGVFGEGTRLPVLTTNAFRGVERRPGGTLGHADTNNNLADFREIRPSTQNNASSPCLAPPFKFPHEVQGNGTVSPLTGTTQTVRGVVTGRTGDGFYVQTASGSEDADPVTSEGLFVSTGGLPPAAAQVGHLVVMTGLVSEYVPASDPGSPSVTQLTSVTTVTDLGAASLPAAYALTPADLQAGGTLGQLERLEGMRVSADLTAVSPTALDGAFFAVLAGQARPFREPGVEAGYPLPACATTSCSNVPLFDGNPERLRVDSDGLLGVTAVQVSTGATVSASGPLGFGARTYTLLPATLSASGGMSPSAAPVAPADQYTVASLNLNQFLDTSDAARLGKASLTIAAMGLPDIVGLQEVESLAVLQSLAARIDADATAAGVVPPAYEAIHAEHANADGLDVAFLVKSGRVTQVSVAQIAADAATEHPSLVLRALVSGPATSLPQAITVIANQLPSADHARRQLEAESLAVYIQDRQINAPNEAIVSLGGYAAFGFNDGFVDVVGTVRGVPAPADQVALASTGVVFPNLLNLADVTPASEQYSLVANGNAQAHDHILASANLDAQFVGLAHARLNADFPEALAADPATPSRLSNRDPLVAYFEFPPDVDAPVFGAVDDQQVEATGPGGASVAFDTPTATDNLDPSVEVMCLPESGSTFPLGNTGVICSAEDEAGNASEVSFTVTVQDTTAPVLTVPGNVVEEAVSAAGNVVSFTATATDAVTTSPAVVCSPASGSTFAVGTTTVSCEASDATGNSSSGTFTVTVRDTTAPVLTVPGNITATAASAAGVVVEFVATASDVVTVSPNVTCTPASGSTFAVGETTVNCVATDAAGNSANQSFVVTVTLAGGTIVGRMAGVGEVQAGGGQVSFFFDVRAAADLSQRGVLLVYVNDGSGRQGGFLAGRVTEVRFSTAQTAVFSGVGWWNGVSGYTFEVTATDNGEPGPGHDTFSVVVRSPGGSVVEARAGTLSHGNIKALREGGELSETGKMKQVRLMLDREAEVRVRGFAQGLQRSGGR